MNRAIALAVIAGALLGCSHTEVQQEWQDPGYSGPASHSVVVLCLPRDSAEKACEDAFTAELKNEGISAIPAYSVPTASAAKESIMAKAREAGISRVLVSRFINRKTEVWERPLEGPGFLGTDWDRRQDYEYIEHQFQVFSTALYDAATGKAIWSALSDTPLRPSEQKMMKAYAKAMVKKLERRKLLTR